MTDGSKIREDVRAAEEAAGWFARLQGEAATGEDWLAFERWLAASPAHERAYDRLEQLWVELDQAEIVRDLGAPPQPARRPLPRHAEGRRTFSRRAWIGAAGAMAAGLAVVAVGVGLRPGAADAGQVYRTAPGETRNLTLADGTHIRLNAASQITVSLGRDARRVEMADAEAVFDVAHDAARPFTIAVGDRTVRVVGTRFDVRRRGGKLSVAVERGLVEVAPAEGAAGRGFRLHPGQRLDHVEGAPDVRLSAVDPTQIAGWKAGRLIYRDAPLADVVADLNQQFAKPITLADPALGAIPVSGVLVLDDQSAVIRRLALLAPIKALPSQQGVLLRRDEAAKP